MIDKYPRSLAFGACEYIANNWVKSSDTNFIKKQLFSRLGFAALVPGYVVADVADTIIGVGAKTVDCLTFGMFESCQEVARVCLFSFKCVLLDPYSALLRTINPEAKFRPKYYSGKVTKLMKNLLVYPAKKFAKSDCFMHKHVVSRLTYALAALAAVVTRVADGVIGLPVAILSIISFGTIESVNAFALDSLKQFPLAVTNFFKYAACAVKPS